MGLNHEMTLGKQHSADFAQSCAKKKKPLMRQKHSAMIRTYSPLLPLGPSPEYLATAHRRDPECEAMFVVEL
jgi:hypothetical protein